MFLDPQKYPSAFSKFSTDDRNKLKFILENNILDTDNKNPIDDEYRNDESFILPREFANYSIPQNFDSEYPDSALNNMLPDTSKEKFRYDQQVLNFIFI